MKARNNMRPIHRGEVHGFAKLKHRVTLYTKMLAFFDKYIGGPRAAR